MTTSLYVLVLQYFQNNLQWKSIV